MGTGPASHPLSRITPTISAGTTNLSPCPTVTAHVPAQKNPGGIPQDWIAKLMKLKLRI